jgi:hypothetical protein
MRLRLGALLLALTSGLVGAASPARSADPGVPWRLPPQDVTAPASSDRLDARGTNQSRVALPASPSLGFHARVVPPIVGQPMSSGGRVLIVHGGDRLSALDERGQTAWSVRLGAELASGPMLVGGNHTLVLGRDGRLFDVSPSGSVSLSDTLPWSEVEGAVLFTPTADGGGLLANGARLGRIGPAGTRGFVASIADPIRAVFEWRGLALAVGQDGSIWMRAASGTPRELGSLGGHVRQALLVADRVLGVGEHELLAFDLASKQAKILWTEPTLELRDVAAMSNERFAVVAGRSLLIELEADGRELARFVLPTGENGVDLTSLIVDQAGRAIVRAGGSPLVFVTPQGDASFIAGTGCPDLLRPTPLAPGKLVSACRSGLVRGVGNQ